MASEDLELNNSHNLSADLPIDEYADALSASEDHIENTSRYYLLRQGLGKTAASIIFMLPAASVGAATAFGVAEMPVDVKTGVPGVSAEANLINTDYSSITYGPTLGIPQAHQNILGHNFGINITVKQFDTQRSIDKAQTLAALAHDPNGTLGSEVKSAVYWQGGEGLAAGLGTFGLLEFGRRRTRRRHKLDAASDHDAIELLQQLQALPADAHTTLPEGVVAKSREKLATLTAKEQKRAKYRLTRRVGAVAVGIGMLTGSALAMDHEANSLRPPEASRTVVIPDNPNGDPLLLEVVKDAPVLKGAFITGDAGYYTKLGILKAVGYMQRINDYWHSQADSLINEALPAFAAQGGMGWQANPNIVAIAEVTDIHDNHPFLQYFLPQVIEATGVDIVANTGDELNNSEKSFLDNGGWERFARALPLQQPGRKLVVSVVSDGNHDPLVSKAAHRLTFKTAAETKYHPLIPLDSTNGYTTTVDGITFVGSPDLNRTSYGTIPATHEGQLANDAKQGKLLADKACEVYEKTKQKPILLSHEMPSTYEAIARGCVKLALSGHIHRTLPTQAFLNRDGSITYQQTLGSASGDGPNNIAAIYNKATTQGAIRIWLYDKSTAQLVNNSITIAINTDGSSSIKSESLPSASQATRAIDNTDIKNFWGTYESGVFPVQTPIHSDGKNLAVVGVK